MKKSLLLVFSLFIFQFCYSQKQGNIWYFGDHAGVDFNTGNPVALTNGQTNLVGCPSACHNEGSSVIADNTGALLFYCNGKTIWNRNQVIMPNGDSLLSNASSTQSSLIIPKPGSSRYFYVFTTDAFFINNLQYGFRYSIVDICLDNGLGDVITGQKNILLLDTIAEKLTAVRHSNGIDYWVIVHKFFSDAFYSFHLTSSGITDTVISHVGSIHGGGSGASIGQLKASPNGLKLAIVNGQSSLPDVAEYFDFDKTTGVVSNCVSIQTNPIFSYYGVSFSPDNSKLYISAWLNANGIFQFNLNAGGGDPDSVKASKFTVTTNTKYGMQLGPDGKIYFQRGYSLSAINNPNAAGLACNYIDSAVSLNGRSCSYGLPNFIDSYDYSNTTYNCSSSTPKSFFASSDSTFCSESGSCIDFFDHSTNNPTSWQWYFPGAVPDTSTQQNPTNICYSTPGTYAVKLVASNSNGSDSLTVSPMITFASGAAPPVLAFSGDTIFCSHASGYQWYFNGLPIPGATDSFYVATVDGLYAVQITDANGCVRLSDGFAVSVNELGNAGGIKISPNPAGDQLTIDNGQLTIGRTVILEINNVLGEKVLQSEIISPKSEINVSALAKGIYFVAVSDGKNIYRTKMVKQ